MATATPYLRGSPFLHRTWKNAAAVLGITGITFPSTQPSTNGDKIVAGDDHGLRATKRRRVEEETPESKVDVVALSNLLHDPPADFEKALRIEVLKVGREDSHGGGVNGLSNGVGSLVKTESPLIGARCKVTVFQWRRKPVEELRPLFCDSQCCKIKVLRDADNVCRTTRVYLPQPFQIAVDKIYVERDDDGGYSLADYYVIQAELVSAGDASWPPLDLLNGFENYRPSPSPPRQWALSSSFTYRLVKGRMSSVVLLRKGPGEDTRTDLKMDIDVRWTCFNAAGSTQRPVLQEETPPATSTPSLNGALEPLTNGHVNGRVDIHVDEHKKDQIDGILDDVDDVESEAHTPSRSLRVRGKQQNYNLKLLSDKARGKEHKERKKRQISASSDSGQVTYILPNRGEVVVLCWACIRCFAEHSSFEQLQLHIVDHAEFKYTFGAHPKGGWSVAVSRHGEETPRPRKSKDALKRSQDDLISDSEEEDKLEDQEHQHSAPHRRSVVKPKQTKQLVPRIKQSLYDRVSKVLLEPGSLVDEPQVDNTWLKQKHRDIIQDYSDVHPNEKEYITAWDAFSIQNKATLAPHLQDVYLDFLREKAAWLATSQNRMTEAMKHLAYLTARNVLSEKTISQALEIVKQARFQARHDQAETSKTSFPSSPRTEPRRSASGCAVCGQPVLGPSTLICSNLDCDKPLYHNDCIREGAKIPVEDRDWRCNDCCAKETAVQEGP